MKTTLITLAAAFTIVFATACDRDGNTGNGANDPTAEFESAKTIKAAGSNENVNDTTANKTTTSTPLDTIVKEGNKY